MTTYAAAKTPTTQAQIRAKILQSLADSELAGWGLTAPQRILVDDVAAFLADEAQIRAALALGIDISAPDTTDEDWIDLFALFFSEKRIPALAAAWNVPLTSSALPSTVQPTTKTTMQATGGAFFDLAESAAVQLPNFLRFAARAPGTSGNVSPTSITRIITGPAGLVRNGTPVLYTAGRNRETNAALVRRCLAKWAVRGAGWTAEAFDFFIPTAAPSLTEWRVDDSNPDGPGTTRAALANEAGAATGPEVAAVQALCASRSVRTLGSGAFTAQAAFEVPLAVGGVLTVDGTNPTAATDAAAAAARYCRTIGIGPVPLVVDKLVAAIIDTPGVVNFEPTTTLELGAATPTPRYSIIICTCTFTVIP